MERPSFEFVHVQNPTDTNNAQTRLRVRAHAARAQRPYRPQQDKNGRTSFLPIRKTLNAISKNQELSGRPRASERRLIDATKERIDTDMSASKYISLQSMMIGGVRTDPFKTYPIPWQPYLPAVVDHYVQHMTVDIPELDGPDARGLLRSSWFPLTMANRSLFCVIILIAASHRATTCNKRDALNLLRLRTEALDFVQQDLENQSLCLSDQMVGAVAKLASYEAMYGTRESYKVHMEGLRRMVMLRGGIRSLGLNGLLSRLVVWIDNNGAFFTGSSHFFDEAEGSCSPDPSNFLVMR
ncbi:hypothetical protein K461DRAFT_298002 [Myriangium duriaei CBS 260.36]|uniref:Transcription factor domain-containing protein n=1 Tax=Myriangium duriaei CBS 260.36 TaxID=1168546 RepID=A0A9P4MD69_9PEZI|nr:hypothetical protein K461DRAFT_298002 [Myriangium duriaei CBS 260.36]